MDEVWMVSLCLTFIAFVVALLSLRKSDDTSASSAKGNEQKSPEPIPSSSQPAARYMELTLEDIEKSLERLGAVLGIESLGDKEPASDSDTQPSLTDPEEQPYRRGGRVFRGRAEHDSAEAWSRPERQDKIKSSEQVDPWRHGAGEGKEILEHPPAATATQNIMEQIGMICCRIKP
ncbi:uncharacterized protein LOC132825184 isoform X2 [Hemiscyllium ocellatum]|uniref:uncharacterized protein LOC132825184 isoform X2 n=1 Tax=Hemiscyllium ocellatum TaxID=170820 RepID=UPI00296643AB|nr:uncharacterized protein LOC132825184 isoform X2 [Hemiscyllium ocellatum]